MKCPKFIFANLPTPIIKANNISKELGVNIYIKRDDYTGVEISGNKIRKLEYALKEAVEGGYTTIITTGGVQSNHCRATTVAAIRLGLKVILLIKTNTTPMKGGNYFLDNLFGAEIIFCSIEEYSSSRAIIMKNISKERTANGERCYIIPEGASYGLGSLGYFDAMEEIHTQEKQMDIEFNTIVLATGSGGTYSGLYLANKYYNLNKRIIGFAVCDNREYFVNHIDSINREALKYLDRGVDIKREDIEINDNFTGVGYAISTKEELEFIKYFARKEAIALDPVYTGKAMYGLYSQIKTGSLKEAGNILFIHTGGLFGLFPKEGEFEF